MGSKQPLEGLCGSKNKDGTYCERTPRPGYTRCSKHDPKERPHKHPLHGANSKVYQRDTDEINARVQKWLDDPDLLEPRRPVALQAMLLEEHGLVPDEATVREMALAAIPRGLRNKHIEEFGEDIDPSPAQLEVARRKAIMHAMEATTLYQRALSDASKQVRMGDLILREFGPMMESFGDQVRRLADRYVPEADRQDFVDGFRRAARHVLVQAAQLEDKI